MRILLICEAFRSIGGVQEVVDNLAAELSAAGHRVAILSTAFVAGPQRSIRFEGECRYLEIPSRRSLGLRHLERLLWSGSSSEIRKLVRTIAEFGPQLVSSHCWSWDRFPTVADVCAQAGVPWVHTLYDSWGIGKMGPGALSSLNHARALTALSEATRQYFEPVLPNVRQARVIMGGVDVQSAAAAPAHSHSRPYVLCAARLDLRHKALDSLVSAFALASREHQDVDLLISGDGPDRAILEEFANSCGLADRVKFLGIVSRTELWSLYKGALLFAMPSRMPEGLGLTFLEAMASGLAVVGTRSGGTPEIVKQGVTGLLVEHNLPDELSSAISSLIKDRGRAIAMGARGRSMAVRCYGWPRFAERYSELYASCLGESS